MTRPHLINNHRYTTDYAGLDPAKALCQYREAWGPECGAPKSDHIPRRADN